MNSKIANVIALELGILIPIMAWLALSRLPSVRQPAVAEEQERAAGSFATVTPVLRSRNRPLYAADYRADPAGGQQANEEQAGTVRQYDQEIATEPYAHSDLNDGLVIESSPSYAVVQEPVIYQPDRLVSPLDQFVACPQPNEVIIFSNVRSFGRRLRSPARFCGAGMMVAHRRPGGRESPARGGGLVSRGNTNARSLPPRHGFRPR